MAKVVDRRSARQGLAGFAKWPPGMIMVTLWLLGMVLFSSIAVTLHVLASVLSRLYAGV